MLLVASVQGMIGSTLIVAHMVDSMLLVAYVHGMVGLMLLVAWVQNVINISQWMNLSGWEVLLATCVLGMVVCVLLAASAMSIMDASLQPVHEACP